MRKFIKWLITICYFLFLTYVSIKGGTSSQEVSQLRQAAHNACHVPAYAILTYLLVWSFASLRRDVLIKVFFISFSYGILMEILQSFSPNRLPSLSDVGLNAIGTGVMIWLLKNRYLKIYEFNMVDRLKMGQKT